MSDRETSETSSTGVHAAAAETFVDRARSQFESDILTLYVFGSVVRGETHGLASDVDVLVVLDDQTSEERVDELRDLAYDVMIEYGPVVELHILSESEFEQSRAQGNPFVQNIVREGRAYA